MVVAGLQGRENMRMNKLRVCSSTDCKHRWHACKPVYSMYMTSERKKAMYVCIYIYRERERAIKMANRHIYINTCMYMCV